jgi:hypothetical protein
MVDDFSPSEEVFRSDSEERFESLNVSIHEGLSLILVRLGGM